MAAFTTSLKHGSVTRFLPQELVNEIVDHLADDPQIDAQYRTLTSCSQVCRGFSVRSQERLFAEIRLKYQGPESDSCQRSQVARFARLLNRSPHLSLYVESFTLLMCYSETKLSEIFQRLKRLRSLLIYEAYCNFDPTIFSHLPSLRSLEISAVHCTFPKPLQSEPLTPVRLEHLLLPLSPCPNSGDFLDNWIFNTPSVVDVSGLRSLYIPEPKVELVEHFSRLFHLCSKRLEILDIQLDDFKSYDLDLSVLSDLQTLRFHHGGKMIDHNLLSQTGRILRTLPSSNKVKSLAFVCEWHPPTNYQSGTWEAIDSALHSMTIPSGLQFITFRNWGRQLSGRSRELLPNTSSLGIVVDFI